MKKKLMRFFVAVLCVVCLSGFAACADNGKDDLLQSQIDALQSQIEQLTSSNQQELASLRARIALLEGKLANPKEFYGMGETITYVSNGVKLFDFVLMDVYKTSTLLTHITYKFTDHNIINYSPAKLSDYIKFAVQEPNSTGYSVLTNEQQFSSEPVTFMTAFSGVGVMQFLLTIPCWEGGGGGLYNPIAKIKFDLQMRVV